MQLSEEERGQKALIYIYVLKYALERANVCCIHF